MISEQPEGSKPQKFQGGRIHLRPIDSIGRDFDLGTIETKGRRHFSFDPTPVMHYKPQLRVGFPKNVTNPEILFTHKSQGGPDKLTYMPPIKKHKDFASTMRKTVINKEYEEQQTENRRMIEELDVWEKKFRKL
ncbi:unnamed protein product [Paramecium octaurelia]|uniref:Uncharacterized protein n=1 Tax=Paramecium octaurelia TaxID=43137 RepID=A0A8S1VCY8_PAROT|nr:unnamed protein product [Paramecium octaurelia]